MRERYAGHHGHKAGEVFVKEWADTNTFNSFNNWKGLLYSDHYKRIAEKGTLLPPIEARIDLTLRCNLDCTWCNSAAYRGRGDELSVQFVMDLIEFLATWGVKGICWAGGGEPSMHPQFAQLIEYAAEKGMKSGILSNGTHTDRYIHEVVGAHTRWAGISVDAGSAKTYKELKGRDCFGQVMDNLAIMVESSVECDVAYKFLISPMNQHEIFEACKMAQSIGVRDFVARPMDTLHQGMANHDIKEEHLNSDAIFHKFEMCHALATDDFRVYTVMHKFSKDFTHSKSFSQCYGAPLKLQIAPDGNVYFCDDQFYQPEYCLGSCAKDPYHIFNLWGKEKHMRLLYGDTPKKCQTRCCIGDYNIQCEELFVNTNDPMCRDFP